MYEQPKVTKLAKVDPRVKFSTSSFSTSSFSTSSFSTSSFSTSSFSTSSFSTSSFSTSSFSTSLSSQRSQARRDKLENRARFAPGEREMAHADPSSNPSATLPFEDRDDRNTPERRSVEPRITEEDKRDESTEADEEGRRREGGDGGSEGSAPTGPTNPPKRLIRPLKRKEASGGAGQPLGPPRPSKRLNAPSSFANTAFTFTSTRPTGGNAIPLRPPPSTSRPITGERSAHRSPFPSLADRITGPKPAPERPHLVSGSTPRYDRPEPALANRIPNRPRPQAPPSFRRTQPSRAINEPSVRAHGAPSRSDSDQVEDLSSRLDSVLTSFTVNTSNIINALDRFNNNLLATRPQHEIGRPPVAESNSNRARTRTATEPVSLSARIGPSGPSAGPSNSDHRRPRGTRGGKKRKGKKRD